MLQTQQILHDRYRLVQLLGETAGRQTWLAADLAQAPPTPVIVKLLAFAEQTNWDPIKLFEREAKILHHLHHPQIPQYRDSFSIENPALWFVLVQEFVAGTTLKDLLARGERFPEQRLCQIATEVLQILIYLHALTPPVFHRDIKPSNLIWGKDGHIHLIDFGAVQDKAAVEGATFTIVGTYGYTPLEQFGGRTVPSSDLYALGATLIHLATGIAPANLPQHQFRIQFVDKTMLRPSLVCWIEKLTEPNVGHRFSNARTALESLEMVMQASASSRHLLPSASREPSHSLIPSQSNSRPVWYKSILWGLWTAFFPLFLLEIMVFLGFQSLPSSNSNQYSPAPQISSTSARGHSTSINGNHRSTCVLIDARNGWQHFSLPFPVSAITSINRGWTVDHYRYAEVGPGGYTGRDAEALTAYLSYKYDQAFPFGALLVGVPSEEYGYKWISQPQPLPYSTNKLGMRINDSDNSLGDNGGYLQVCLQD